MRRLLMSIVAVLAVAAGGTAQVQTADLEVEAKQIETMLIAPCCWRQPISDHQSEIAGQMKAEVRKMLQDGQGRQEILDHYVNQYGARILSIPPQQGFNRMSFIMPVVVGVAGVLVVVGLLKSWHRRTALGRPVPATTAAGTAPSPPLLSEEMTRRIEKELETLE